MRSEASGVSASVRQRLKNLARQNGDDFQDVLWRHCLARFYCRHRGERWSRRFTRRRASRQT